MVPPRRHQRPQLLEVGRSDDPHSLVSWANRFLAWSRVRGYSPLTIRSHRINLRLLLRWAEPRGIERPSQVTRSVLERYQSAIHHHRQRSGAPLTARSQNGRLVSVRSFFSWLTKQGAIGANPAADLELVRREHRIPHTVLTAGEVERVLAVPDVGDVVGLRDRVIMEVLYSTAMRRGELAALGTADVDFERQTMMVRLGKGRKDRVVPIGLRALRWVRRYLDHARPELLVPPDHGALFLSTVGTAIDPDTLTRTVSRHVQAAKLGKSGACHLFRHTAATLMLEHGADLRHLQVMLGHAQPSTTAIYAKVSIKRLREIHARTHPAANDGPDAGHDTGDDDGDRHEPEGKAEG